MTSPFRPSAPPPPFHAASVRIGSRLACAVTDGLVWLAHLTVRQTEHRSPESIPHDAHGAISTTLGVKGGKLHSLSERVLVFLPQLSSHLSERVLVSAWLFPIYTLSTGISYLVCAFLALIPRHAFTASRFMLLISLSCAGGGDGGHFSTILGYVQALVVSIGGGRTTSRSFRCRVVSPRFAFLSRTLQYLLEPTHTGPPPLCPPVLDPSEMACPPTTPPPAS
jgi:hypothetical protein